MASRASPRPAPAGDPQERSFARSRRHGPSYSSRFTAWATLGISRATRTTQRQVSYETLTHYGRRTIMVQRYTGDTHGDKRVLLIGGKAVPWACAHSESGREAGKSPPRHGVRASFRRDREIAQASAHRLPRRAGCSRLDVIGDYLTEVNVTSPTCFQEIMQQTGFNVAGLFLDALEVAVTRPA